MKRIFALVLILCLMLPGVAVLAEPVDAAAETPAPEPTPAPVEELGDFVVGATTKLSGDFFTNMWGNNTCDIDVRQMLHGYSPVVWTTQATFETDPMVVYDLSSAQSSTGNKVYTIQLLKDLKYNDGTPITAVDYVFSLMLNAAPQVTAIDGITANVGYIEGSDEFLSGATGIFSGLRILGPYEFSIEIKGEYLPFFFELSMLDAIPYPISVIAPGCEVVDDGQGAYIRNIDRTILEPIFTADLLRQTILDPDTGYLAHPMVTCGPYKLTSFDWETRIARFNINPFFKGNHEGQRPTIDNIVFKSVLPETMMTELANGDVQLLNKVVAATDINEGLGMVRESVAAVSSYYRMGLGFLTFSCEQGPTQFEPVREAIAYSLDVKGFTDQYNEGYGSPVYGYYGLGQWMVLALMGNRDQFAIATDTEAAEWDAFPALDENFELYEPDAGKALGRLIDDGWTLNKDGQPYQDGVDEYRCKMVNDELMPLILKWGKMQDSVAADLIETMLPEKLTALGIKVEITVVPFVDLLEHYYRQVDRTYDMMYLATNFISVFDPYFVFNTQDIYQGKINTTGYRDARLEELAFNLRRTEPGNLLEYTRKWLEFQKYFNDKLPMLPIYSNLYFDFYTPRLVEYSPESEMSWPVAILYAQYLKEGEVLATTDDTIMLEDVK